LAARPKLSERLFAVLEEERAKGPVAHGWEDLTWTPERIKTLIGRRFHQTITLRPSRRCSVATGGATRCRRSRPWSATRRR
jgi:hypothetical protein